MIDTIKIRGPTMLRKGSRTASSAKRRQHDNSSTEVEGETESRCRRTNKGSSFRCARTHDSASSKRRLIASCALVKAFSLPEPHAAPP